jgi:hypothetical protein
MLIGLILKLKSVKCFSSFQHNFTGVKKRPDKPVLKPACITKSKEVSKTGEETGSYSFP